MAPCARRSIKSTVRFLLLEKRVVALQTGIPVSALTNSNGMLFGAHVFKSTPVEIEPIPFDRQATRKAMAAIEKIMTVALGKLGESAAQAVQAELGAGTGKALTFGSDILRKGAMDDAATIGAILASIDWNLLLSTATATGRTLQAVAQDAMLRSLDSLGVTSTPAMIRDIAAAAKDQAAALGKTLVDGTKSMIETMLETSLEVGGTAAAIAAALRASRIFSTDRAATIALTETVAANGAGSLAAIEAGGAKKQWLTAGDEDVDSVCLINEAAGPIPADAMFPSGHAAPGAHPNCRCVIIPVIEA